MDYVLTHVPRNFEFFDQNSDFGPRYFLDHFSGSIFGVRARFRVGVKMEMLVTNRNVGHNRSFVKIEILVKNRNFGQKSKLWSQIEMLVKNSNFGQKSKFWSKI